MWWIIGTIIGTAWNLHEEKKHPEIREKREKEAREGCRDSLIQLAVIFVALVVVLIIGSVELSSDQSTGPANIVIAKIPRRTDPLQSSTGCESANTRDRF